MKLTANQRRYLSYIQSNPGCCVADLCRKFHAKEMKDERAGKVYDFARISVYHMTQGGIIRTERDDRHSKRKSLYAVSPEEKAKNSTTEETK